MKEASARVHGKVRVFLVDDHPIVRRGFQFLLGGESDMSVCGEAESAPEAFQKISALHPDVVIVDLALKGGSGLELIKQLRNSSRTVKILVYSMYQEMYYAERALRGGADAYMTKEEGPEKAVEVLRLMMQGQKYVSQALNTRMLDKVASAGRAEPVAGIENLSDRELEVLQLVGAGISTRQIAEQLHLSVKTVESHRKNIKEKLGLKSGLELVKYAIDWAQTGI